MPAIAEAKEYLRLMKTASTSHCGPLRLFDDPKKGTPLSELAKKVHSEIVRIDERIYRAPSAWHPAAWMLDQAALIAQLADLDGASGLKVAYGPKFGAPVFRDGKRGQSSFLTPSENPKTAPV